MKEKVLNFLKSYGVDETSILVIGVSGGPDSLSLLSVLKDITKDIPFSLIAAHINHNVRKESVKEKKFVEEWCIKRDICFEAMTIEQYGDDNFHNEARNIRYQFFGDIVEKYHANFLITAHHADDLMETILMRLVRGSTLKGYGGFQEMVDYGNYKLLRPLISITKDEILIYAKKHRINFVTDRSNFKTKYTRNRYRKTILPFLKKEDTHVHEKFLKFSHLLGQYDQFIDVQTKKALSKVYKDQILHIEPYKELESLLQTEVIYSILEDVYQDDLMLVNDRHVQLIKSLISSRKSNAFIYLPNRIKVTKSYELVQIMIETGEITSYEIELIDYALLPNGKQLEMLVDCEENGNHVCRLDSSDITLPLYIRTRNYGDKMEMKGTLGHRKIKDIMIDEKIPAEQRELWPIVVDSKDQIVWIPGLKKSKFNKLKNEKCDIIIKYY